MELAVRKCDGKSASSCEYTGNEEIVDSSRYFGVEYKPREEDLSWKYHGLFVTGQFYVHACQLERYNET